MSAPPEIPPVSGPQTQDGASPLTAGNEYSLVAPGDPASCRATAKALRTLAASLSKVHQGQADDAGVPDSTLGGHTGDAFRKGAKQVEKPIHELRHACLTGAAALDQLVLDMQHLQHMYDHVRTMARAANPAFVSSDGNYLVRPANGAFNACTPDTPAGWDDVAAAYVDAVGYQVGAQKAYLKAINATTYSAVDADTVLANGLNNGSGYTPTPAPKNPHPQHHPKHSHQPTPTPTPTPVPSGGGGPSSSPSTPPPAQTHHTPTHHAPTPHPHATPAHHHLTPHEQKVEKLQKEIKAGEQQSASLQHRIEVMQQAITADPTNTDNQLLHQEINYLGVQLSHHQEHLQQLTTQLAQLQHPHHAQAVGVAVEQIRPDAGTPSPAPQPAAEALTSVVDQAAPVAPSPQPQP